VLVFVVFAGNDEQTADAMTTLPAATTLVTQPTLSTETTSEPAGTETSATAATAGNQQSGDDTGAAEAAVRTFLQAMESQDGGMILDLMDPAIMGAIPAGDMRDAAVAAMKTELQALGKMKFSGIEMKVEITSPTTATATLTAGQAIITDASGNTTTEDVKDASSDASIDLVKVDGRWYISSTAFL
jgi:hypothetical protein